jgi:hypothetical protein
MKNRFFATIALLGAVAVATLLAPSGAYAQANTLALTPSGAIDQPQTFLPATGIHFTVTPAVAVASTTATGTTAVFTVPQGYLQAPTYSGGLPVPGGNATLKFYVTGIEVETTAVTGLTAGAVFQLGNENSPSNIISTGTLSSSAAAGSFQVFPVTSGSICASGDVVNFKITTAATATSQAILVHVLGYYQ